MNYRVKAQHVRFGECTVQVYGPYLWYFWAVLVAHWVCGPWDYVIVQSRDQWQS